MTSQSERDLIVALFHRIGEQLELKDEWKKLPNAERSVMAGDFYNIIVSHSSKQSDQIKYGFDPKSATCQYCAAHKHEQEVRQSEQKKVLDIFWNKLMNQASVDNDENPHWTFLDLQNAYKNTKEEFRTNGGK